MKDRADIARACGLIFILVATVTVAGRQIATINEVVEKLSSEQIRGIFPLTQGFQFSRTNDREASFLAYGEKLNEFVHFDCSPGAVFSILSRSGKQGGLSVGSCTRHRQDVLRAVKNASSGVSQTIEALKRVGNAAGIETVQKRMGWQYESTTLADGSRLYYFPVLLVGHGLLSVSTAVLVTDEHVIVIQAGSANLCHYDQNDPKFCTDAKSGLFQLMKLVYGGSFRK